MRKRRKGVSKEYQRSRKFKPMGGLRETPPDNRDFQLGNITKLPKLEDLPDNFFIQPISLKDQKGSDMCSAFGTCYASEQQESVELEPTWSFAISKMLSGDPDEWGQDMRTACKGHVRFGAIKKTDSPYNLGNKDDNFLRQIENWPKELFDKAAEHKKKTFFKVNGNYDAFDNLRANIYHYKSMAIMGLIWGWPISQIFMEEPSTQGFGHLVAAIGWITEKDSNELFIVVQNSYGESAGANGKNYLSRKVINDAVEKYSSFMFLDLDRTTAEVMNKYKIRWSWLAKLLSFFNFNKKQG